MTSNENTFKNRQKFEKIIEIMFWQLKEEINKPQKNKNRYK